MTNAARPNVAGDRRPEVHRYADLAQASAQAARLIMTTARNCTKAGRPFTLALAGGTTPQTLYRLLAAPPYAEQLRLARTHLFWGDERCVPPSHPDSNYGMSQPLLLDALRLPTNQVHRMPGEIRPLTTAASNYEDELRQFFTKHAQPGDVPRFDLILLGLGLDGHTASLLPGAPALAEKKRWVAAVDGATATPPLDRLTLTLPVLNQADNVVLLLAGKAKARLAQEIIDDKAAARHYPAALVRPTGRLFYLVGEEPGG